jgi:hypothetical protein
VTNPYSTVGINNHIQVRRHVPSVRRSQQTPARHGSVMTSFALPRLPKPAVHPRCIQLSHGGPLTRPGSRGVQPNPQHVKYNPASRELEVYTDWSARDTMSREGRRRTLHRIHNRALSGTQQLKQRPSLNTVHAFASYLGGFLQTLAGPQGAHEGDFTRGWSVLYYDGVTSRSNDVAANGLSCWRFCAARLGGVYRQQGFTCTILAPPGSKHPVVAVLLLRFGCSHIAPLCRRSGVKAFRRGFKDKAREARVQHEQKEQLEKDLGEFNWRNTRHPIRSLLSSFLWLLNELFCVCRPALGLGIIDSLYLSETFV